MQSLTKYLLTIASISAVLIGMKLGISTRSHTVNVLIFFSLFVAYSYIALGAFSLKPRLLGLGLGSLLSLPIAVSVLALPIILLVAFWALKDFAAGPDTVVPMANGLLCAEYSSGSAVTEATETFELDRPVLGVFLLRLAVDSGPILEDYPVQKGCTSIYQTWKSSQVSTTQRVSYDRLQ